MSWRRWLSVAAARPDATAMTDAAGDLSYRALLRRIERLAGAMAGQGIGRGARVGICLPRTRDLPVAMLATLSTGAAYVPLDPSYPKQRLAAIIADAKPSVVIVDRQTAARFPGGAPLLFIEVSDDAPEGFAPVPAAADDLAYIIHTSGSTGRPVGVEIERGALANLLAAMRAELPLSAGDTLLAVTPYSFDIAALELLLPLTIGARIVIADEACARDGRLLSARIDRGDVTVMQATPATWQMLVDAGWKGNGRLTALCGGEALPPALAAEILARTASLWNLYGPTETTVWSTFARITNADGAVPIGRPIANTSCLVVDEMLEPVGPGIAGELLIGGAGLARGYHNDPARTAERFISDPLDPRGRPQGVPHRRFRARAARTALCSSSAAATSRSRSAASASSSVRSRRRCVSHPSVRGACVLAIGDDLLDRRLAAFVVADLQTEARPNWRHICAIGCLTTWFRTASVPSPPFPDCRTERSIGSGLPQRRSCRPRRAAGLEKPRTPVEAQLVALLEDLLAHDRIGLDDNFFSLGGHLPARHALHRADQ